MERLVAEFKQSPVLSPADTTDVEVFQRLTQAQATDIADAPLWMLFGYSFLHSLFNQEKVWQEFLDEGAITYEKPYEPNFNKMEHVLRVARSRNEATRSSNYYSVTLREVSDDGGANWRKPSGDEAVRDALAAQIVWICVPRRTWELYEAAPSRDFWAACCETFLENMEGRAKGVCDHYMLKCALDRLFSVARIEPATVSWWPVNCPAYLETYPKLWRHLPAEEEKYFKALMYIYKRLRAVRPCTIPTALAQTCWLMKAGHGRPAYGCRTRSAKGKTYMFWIRRMARTGGSRQEKESSPRRRQRRRLRRQLPGRGRRRCRSEGSQGDGRRSIYFLESGLRRSKGHSRCCALESGSSVSLLRFADRIRM